MHVRQDVKTGQVGLRIALFAGGGGTDVMLPELARDARDITAISPVSDDGEDSGRVRGGLGWAPGDVRRALAALAADPNGLMARLFRVRIDTRFPDRNGQSFGNSVFVAAALCGLDIAGQIEAAARLLGVTGTVFPATFDSVQLVGEMADGAIVHGETAIADYPAAVRRVRLDPERAAPPAGARQKIARADCIVVGPGSVATSLLPALLPSADAVAASRAARFLIINAWNEGDHDFCTAADYVRFITEHFPGLRLFDCVLVHQPAEGGNPASSGGWRPVEADLDVIRAMGYAAVGASLLGPDGRHDGVVVAALIKTLTPQFSRHQPSSWRSLSERVSIGDRPVFSILESRRTSCHPLSVHLCRPQRRLAAREASVRSQCAAHTGTGSLRRHQRHSSALSGPRGESG